MRNLAFIAIGVLLLLVQGNLYRALGALGWHGVTPDLVLPLVVFIGVHEASMARGALQAFCLGYALDICASAPVGLFAFVSVAIWWLARVVGVRLTAQTVVTQMALALGFAVAEAVIVLVLLVIFGADPQRPKELSTIVLPRALSTALLSPLVFRLAQRLHQSTSLVAASVEAPAR